MKHVFLVTVKYETSHYVYKKEITIEGCNHELIEQSIMLPEPIGTHSFDSKGFTPEHEGYTYTSYVRGYSGEQEAMEYLESNGFTKIKSY